MEKMENIRISLEDWGNVDAEVALEKQGYSVESGYLKPEYRVLDLTANAEAVISCLNSAGICVKDCGVDRITGLHEIVA